MRRHLRWIQNGVFLAGSLSLCGCSDFVESVPSPKLEKGKSLIIYMPVDWTITDVEGRTLDVTVVGREPNSITIERKRDGKRFELPFERLSKSDQERASKLSLKAAPPEESGALKLRKTNLVELDQEIEATMTELQNATSQIKYRSLNSTLERLRAERAKLASDIAELERP